MFRAPAFALACTVVAMSMAARAQTAGTATDAQAAAPAATTGTATTGTAAAGTDPGVSRGGEPEVRHIVVDDENARIEELRVRGVTKRITVYPKKGGRPYEILPRDTSRDISSNDDLSRGSTGGQRVWNVFSF